MTGPGSFVTTPTVPLGYRWDSGENARELPGSVQSGPSWGQRWAPRSRGDCLGRARWTGVLLESETGVLSRCPHVNSSVLVLEDGTPENTVYFYSPKHP